MEDALTNIHSLTGPAAVPRLNGEILFDAPWEARVFGAAVGLHEAGHFEWSVFHQALIDAIEHGCPGVPYYESWMEALRNVMLQQNFVTNKEVDERVADYLEGRRTEVF